MSENPRHSYCTGMPSSKKKHNNVKASLENLPCRRSFSKKETSLFSDFFFFLKVGLCDRTLTVIWMSTLLEV